MKAIRLRIENPKWSKNKEVDKSNQPKSLCKTNKVDIQLTKIKMKENGP